MSSKGTSRVDIVCDILKLLHREALTRSEIRKALGYNDMTVHNYVLELERNGILTSHVREQEGKPGRAPLVFRVAAAWGGLA